MEVKAYRVEGMICEGCKTKIENHLMKLNGIVLVNVDLVTDELKVVGDRVYDDFVQKVVNGLGYKLVMQ